jgi:hypothetical protein
MRKINRPPCPDSKALEKNYKHPENKLALQDAFFGKCMYCESKVSHVYFGDVEHIRPKANGKYPHLEFVWSNLGYCCSRCNNAKSDQFDEACAFIDPYSEDPSEHIIAFGPTLLNRAGSERGALTILKIDLNRAELIERRAIRIQNVQKAIDACYRTRSNELRAILLDSLKEEVSIDREFSLIASTLLALHT